MGTTLTGTTPQDTYDSLIKVTDNGPLIGSLKTLTDGLGNDSALALSTGSARVTGPLTLTSATAQLIVTNGADSDSGSFTGVIIGGSNAANARSASIIKNTSSPYDLTIRSQNATGVTTGSIFFQNGSTTQMTITDTGNVGIGTSSPASYYSNQLVVSAPLENGITIANSSGTGSNYLMFANGTTGNERFRGFLEYSHAGDYMVLATSGAEKIRILSTGGLTFNGDTAAANALDDYEEGTWTVGLVAPTSGSYTLGTNAASYTKIGRKVTVTGIIIVSGISSPVGVEAYITGLPFTIENSLNARGSANASFLDSSLSYATTNTAILFLNNETQLRLRLDAATINSGDEIWFTATYFV